MIYILHGPDDFTRNEKIAQLRARFDPTVADLNVTMLEGGSLTLGQIRNTADAMPFMADSRLVIVNGYLRALKGKPIELEQLADYLGRVPPTTDLVLAESDALEKRHPILKAAEAAGAEVMGFGDPAKDSLRPWIIQRTQQFGAAIEPAAAELLGRLVGADLRTLNSELEKLSLYVANQRAITRADVELLVPYHEEAEDFGLTNAIGHRNAAKAFDQLHKLLDEGKHELAILASIATQIRGLLEIKDMAERGLTPPEIAKLKGWKSDYAVKMRLQEAANFSAARLEEILEMLLQIDLDIKTGRIESKLALDTLIARLCVRA